ncbi:MAG: hypothetical protein U9Q63_03090 [Patescibacteria group bacterium]|nr:hypothetical protein [Patescibacteria group bacterium]
MKQYNTQPILTALKTAKTVLILLPQNPNLDIVSAGLSLYLSLLNQQKNPTIGCSTPMTVNFNRLFAVDKIKSNIGNQNLVISFQYDEDSLEKVSYDKDPQNKKIHLTIEPKAGFPPLDSQSVKYSYTGSNADLIFIIGTKSKEDLGSLYQQEKTLLDDPKTPIVNLSNLDKNTQFGTVNIYDPTSTGCSEITFTVLKSLNLSINQDIATNLLTGIESATNNLAQASSPETYETVAELIRLGAKKGYILSTPRPTTPFTSKTPRQIPSWPTTPSLQPTNQLHPVSTPNKPPQLSQSIPQQPSTKPLQRLPEKSRAPQPDWLKPKVLTSSSSKI